MKVYQVAAKDYDYRQLGDYIPSLIQEISNEIGEREISDNQVACQELLSEYKNAIGYSYLFIESVHLYDENGVYDFDVEIDNLVSSDDRGNAFVYYKTNHGIHYVLEDKDNKVIFESLYNERAHQEWTKI